MPQSRTAHHGHWQVLVYSTLLAACLLLTGCLGKQNTSAGTSAAKPATKPSLSVCLLRTDMGLADGCFVRDADAACNELVKANRIVYSTVGELPVALEQEGGAGDIGMPTAPSGPGRMNLLEAQELLAKVPASDLLVLSSAMLLEPALERIKQGQLAVKAVLVLDNENWKQPAAPAVPVYRFEYDIKQAAFLSGVAAAASSNNGMFLILGTQADPQAQEFVDCAEAGARWATNGAQVYTAVTPVAAGGEVTQREFQQTFGALMQEAGSTFRSNCNHFILALGRATPTVAYALTQTPWRGYVATGYADYRQVRPARVIGGVIKRPGVMLRELFNQTDPATAKPYMDAGVSGLAQAMPQGVLKLGLEEGAVELPDYDLYSRYNTDADTIEGTVSDTKDSLLGGDIDLEAELKNLPK